MRRRKFLTDATTVVFTAAVTSVSSNVVASTLGASSEPVRTRNRPNERSEKGFVVKAGQSRFGEKTILFGINPNDIKVSAKDTDGTLSILEYTGRVKGGPPMHINPNQDEIFYVLDGTYRFSVGGEIHQLTAGDLIFAPRNVAHTFAQLTDTGRLIFFLQPSGKMEDYFRKLGTLTSKFSPEEGAKLFADYDMKLVGPPLPID